nr:hypothetical protein [Kofleriaceae bacterium]
MTKIGVCAIVLGAACSSNHGSAVDAGGKDAKALDAAIDAQEPIDSKPIDAGPTFDFSCAGSALGSADATITVSGTTDTLSMNGLKAVGGVSLTMFRGSDNKQLATTGPTDSTGAFAFAAQTTDLNPLDIYIEGSDGSDRPSFLYPSAPLVHDFSDAPVAMVSPALLSELSIVGASENAGSGLLVVQAVDCTGATVTTASLTVQQNGADVGAILDIGNFSSAFAGTFLVTNVPVGTVTVAGAVGGTPDVFASHDVTSFADGDTETQIHP